MSLFHKPAASVEARAVTSLPWAAGGPSPSASESMEGQLSLVPVYAATRLIADAVASLPIQAYRKTADGRVPIRLPGVFDVPVGVSSTRFDWVQRAMVSLLLRGNAYGLVAGSDLESPGVPSSIEWLNPDLVRWDSGRWIYNDREVPAAQMLHIPAMVMPGAKLGLSPIGACSATLRTGHETQKFMRDWYRNKALPGMLFQNSELVLTAEQAAAAKERVQSTLRAGEPFVTGKDWKLDIVRLSADDAGFVSSSKLNATQIANIFGVPAEMIGGETGSSLHYTTTEQNQIQFITHTLRPWLVRLESAFSNLLPRPQYVKFNADALIRVDAATRYGLHRTAREIGLNNIDELRKIEDMEPLPNGTGQDFTPLSAKSKPVVEGDMG